MLISDFKLHRKNGTQWQRMQKRQEGECFLICKFLTNLSVIKINYSGKEPQRQQQGYNDWDRNKKEE